MKKSGKFWISTVTGMFILVSLMAVWPDRCAAESSPDEESEAIYITQMDKSQPQAALSNKMEQNKWQVISYETEALKGTMVGAISLINAPDLTIPLNVTGWHKIYIAYWHPDFIYNDDTVIKVKLSDQPVFRVIRESRSADQQGKTFLRETFFDCANLTGRDLVIGKSNGIVGKQMFLAYVKLVPMTAQEVEDLEKDRADNSTRNLAAIIDGASYFHTREFTRTEDVLSLVEPYRYSDVDRVLWAVCYGSVTNYPTQVEGASFRIDGAWPKLLGQAYNQGNHGTTVYQRAEQQTNDTLGAFRDAGIIPQQLAAKYVHAMEKGIKFDLMFRLGIIGHVPRRIDSKDFVVRYPQYRQQMRDGTVIEKASYAFPAVQQMMLDMIRESTTMIDADGINLCFVRGPHLLWYEKPILDAFQFKYGEDARQVDPMDPRLLEVRASFMTDFIRKVRQVLDEVGSRKGKRLELGIFAWPHDQHVWLGKTPMEEGLDIKAWIKEGLLDSIICQGGIDKDYLELGKLHDCTLYVYPESPEVVAKTYEAGVEHFAQWDIDFKQTKPEEWAWLRRTGHREEMKMWDPETHKIKNIRLHTIDGIDMLQGMAAAVYSGG
jgi:hypothetical protein